MFYRLYADNYRCLANFELPLEALSVLVGPNGSGKSASLLLVAKLRDFILGRETSTDLFPTGSLTRWDTRGEQTFELGVRLAQGDYLYRLRLFHLPQNSLNRIEEEKLSLDGKPLFETRGGKTKLYSERHEAGQSLLTNSRNSGVSQVPDLP